MNEYAEEYSDEAAYEAESPEELQAVSESLDSDSGTEEEESVQQSQPVDDYGPQIRDMYGRYGQVNDRMDEINSKLDELSSNLSSTSSHEQSEDNIYNSMDAAQREAAQKLVEQHPVVKELREFKKEVLGRQEQASVQQARQNQLMLSQAIDDVKKQHGEREAQIVASDLVEVAKLANWDLKHPYFNSRLQSHVERLNGGAKTKQQERQRATSERGSSRSSGGRLPTAKRKSPQGREYYSFEAAAEIAEQEAARNRTKG
jgi:chromosome segregation ATPase